MTLPTPSSDRWKPLRAGLVDMFYYDVEEFHFHDGRLLLRGNNGTGKSKVLALTLPFLLDGELAPHRVEPDGDRQKKMEWNLLLGGRHPHPERLGYTWLEFGRRAADGTAEFRTIGCGLKAVKDRGIAQHWFFVTSQRIGAGLSLLSPTRTALTREKLREALDGQGMLYQRTSDYRRAVDEALFGLGEHRYEALVNLLIQLRQPQLSKKPDEKLLSRALTEALPPLDPPLITTVAEAFRGLDEERDALRAYEESRQAAADFLGHYRRYARIAAKRKATPPRTTQSRYEQLGRDFADAENRYAAAQAALATAQRLLAELAEQKTRLEARRDALQQSPEMRTAAEIKRLGENANRLADYSHNLDKARDDLAKEAGHQQQRAERLRARADETANALRAARDQAASDAGSARCREAHIAIVDRREADLLQARRDTAELADRRSKAVAELDRRLTILEDRRRRLDAARREIDRLTGELQRAAERIAAVEQQAGVRAADLVGAYFTYLADVTELPIADPDAILAALEAWVDTADGRNPAAVAVDEAMRTAVAELSRIEAGLDAEADAQRRRSADLTEQIRRLEAGGHDGPPVPYTRAADARTDRPGAPFWKVVDFADEVPAEHRAGLEAALEAAGILDAWVTPQGTLVGPLDTTILTRAAIDGPACSAVLRPAIDRADRHAAALTDGVVDGILASIGLGPGAATWIATDGRWANGVLGGAWRKPSADHIGEGAREAALRARLQLLRGELDTVRRRLEELGSAKESLAIRRETLAAEHRALPSDTSLREAHVKLAAAHERHREVTVEHGDAVDVAAERQAEVAAAQAEATEFADDVDLPTDAEELATVRRGVSDYRLALAALWPAVQALVAARDAVRDAVDELARVRERLETAAAEASEARDAAASAAETYRTLVETAGAAVEELFRKIDEVREALGRRNDAERVARTEEQAAFTERGKAEGRIETLRDEIDQAGAARDAAVAEFRAFAATGLLGVAMPDLDTPDPSIPWAPTPAVVLARTVNAELDGVDDGDAPWERVQKRVAEEQKQLSDAMARHGHSAGLTIQGGVMVVDVVFQGRARDIPGLAHDLETEIGHRAQLLSAQEREILENHLLNEVAGTLHELIAAAEQEVREMNTELESRPTSTGMRLRLVWKTLRNAPPGLDRVREKLRQTVDAWSEDDRAAVGAFLQEQIAREHTDNPASGWTEQLTRALDYRTWHEFGIQRLQDGQWRPATGPASGGERVLAASVPLFAAASAHYKSAGNPYAPRLVALDEAFAGVDDDSRAKCLGLLATFDMDVVMTSEREWGCYPQVPGLAIAQLSRRDGIDAVLVTPWRWDGSERRRVARPVAHQGSVAEPGDGTDPGRDSPGVTSPEPVLGEPAMSTVPRAQPGLFD